MRSWTIAFATGVCIAQTFAEIPSPWWLLAALTVAAASLRLRLLRLPLALLLGIAWALLRAALVLQSGLPAELEGRAVTVEGRVIGLPETDATATRFRLVAESIRIGARQRPLSVVIRLDWRNAPPGAVRAGERWRLPVRLKRPHGFSNPGGFDYELWLFQQRIRATGVVLGDGRPQRLEAAGRSLTSLRSALGTRLHGAIGDHPLHGVVEALAIGDRSDITPAQWQVFFRTNTGHLIAISGLHIGLIAMAGYSLGRRLWSLSVHALRRVPAQRIGALASVASAAVYCLLAGFEVPSQRTLIMIAVVAAAQWRARRVLAADTLLSALLLVLLIDPLAVTAVGFWLSFIAVAILLYAMDEVGAVRSIWQQVGRVHVVMAIGLTPLLVLFFGQQPVAGPIANLFAVPWVSFVVVPLTLIGTFTHLLSPLLGYWFLRGALLALDCLWRPLDLLAQWHWASPAVAHPSLPVLLSAACGVAILLLPRGLPSRIVGAVLLAPLFLHSPPRPAAGDVELTVLDVGQGLCAVVRTREHVLVFDAGPAFGDRFDTGDLVLVPFLRYFGIRAIDTLVVSHGDNDHIGGVPALIESMPVAAVLSSVPDAISHPKVSGCQQGQTWEWSGVRFEMLGPGPGFRGSDNDGSCVLRVFSSSTGQSALLTGDIEAAGEQRLIAARGDVLASTVVIAPHHGSRSSSTAALVQAVRAKYVVFPVGYRNRWRFPDATVAERWRLSGSQLLRTDQDGAVNCRVAQDRMHCEGHRRGHRRYWNTSSGMPEQATH